MKFAIPIIIISLVVSIVMVGFFLVPKYQELSALKTQINQKKIQLENQHKYIQQLKVQESKLKENQEIVSKIDSAIPDGPDIPSLLAFLQETSVQAGISIENMGWEELPFSSEKERVKQHTFGLSISGSYFAFKNFLSAIERSSRIIDVVQVSFSVPQELEQSILFKLVTEIHSY